jgi:hypothetical protein
MVWVVNRRIWLHASMPNFVRRKIVSLCQWVFLACFCGSVILHGADAMPPPQDDGAIPPAVKEEDFEALLTNSPFTRSLGVSDSIILTGIAQFENDVFATLLDTKTMESHVVSKTANFQGWQLVGVGGNAAEMRTWSAKIQVPGGEVVSIRYQQPPKKTVLAKSGAGSSGGSAGNSPPLSSAQLSEAKNAAVNYKEGFSLRRLPQGTAARDGSQTLAPERLAARGHQPPDAWPAQSGPRPRRASQDL